MQDDLAAAYPDLHITVLGVNEAGQESGNSLAVATSDLVWTQDVDADLDGQSDLWDESWHVEWRDVIILNGANERVYTLNLTTHDLRVAEHYATLRGAFLRTAIQDQRPWCNADNPLDVDQNGAVSLADFQQAIAFLNEHGAIDLAADATPTARVDCDFDGRAAPIDALRVLNYLNAQATGGDGEPAGPAPATQARLVNSASDGISPAAADALFASWSSHDSSWRDPRAASVTGATPSRDDFATPVYVVPQHETIQVAPGGEEDSPASRLGDAIREPDVLFGLRPTGDQE